jgi:CubicO group peptidase (beta-lactamase class C family)
MINGVYAIGTVILTLLFYRLAAAGGSTVDQRIQHIEDALLPPVLVQGESTPLTSLTSRMAALQVPGVSIAVIHGGRLEWARGFGVANIGGPPVTPETLFQAASISKPVTTLAVLDLVQAGKLDLDADVNQYLKTWKLLRLRVTAFWSPLSTTSAWPNPDNHPAGHDVGSKDPNQ